MLALAGNAWANLLAYFGWALFGVASLQARVYPPATAMLLTVGALIAAPFSILLAAASPVLVYTGIAASIVFNGAVATRRPLLGDHLPWGNLSRTSPALDTKGASQRQQVDEGDNL